MSLTRNESHIENLNGIVLKSPGSANYIKAMSEVNGSSGSCPTVGVSSPYFASLKLP